MKYILSLASLALALNSTAQCDILLDRTVDAFFAVSQCKADTCDSLAVLEATWFKAEHQYQLCVQNTSPRRNQLSDKYSAVVYMSRDNDYVDDLRKSKHILQSAGTGVVIVGAVLASPALVTVGGIAALGGAIVGLFHDKEQDRCVKALSNED